MEFLVFVMLIGIAYLLWRLVDQLPDIIFRLSEIQRDVAEMLRRSKNASATEPGPSDEANQDKD